MPALLRQVLSMRNQSFPESTGQQGVAGVVSRATEVLAGHPDQEVLGLHLGREDYLPSPSRLSET